jgi:hypothetical protein
MESSFDGSKTMGDGMFLTLQSNAMNPKAAMFMGRAIL